MRSRTAFIALASLTTLVSGCGSAETPSSTGSSGGSSPSAGAFGISGVSSGGSVSGSGGSVSGSGGADTAGSGQAGGAGSGGSSGAGRGGMPGSSGGTSGGSFGGAGNPPRAGAGGSGGTTASAGAPSNASGASAGGAAGAGSDLSSQYPCDGTTTGYDAVVTQSGSTYRVMHGGSEVYSGADFQQALSRAYASLSAGRTRLESILVQASGDIPATAQLGIPSYTLLNVCGTVNVSGTPSGSDRSPFYARNARSIEIPNLKMTGSPQYGIFFRQTNDIHLGHIELRLTAQAGIGIRVDSGPSASTMTTFNENLTIDFVYGTGMGSHIVETYGISHIVIGAVEGEDVGECGVLLNRSIYAEIGSVTCTGCATGTGYAAFRVANSVGKVGSEFPEGNIHVGKVTARGGGRGIFSVSGSGGLTIDEIDLADTGSTPILLQNCYNTTIAAKSGRVSKGLVQLTNDTNNTNNGTYPPSKNVTLQNLTLSNGASVRQDWCTEFGKNGSRAVNITGGTVTMCP